MTREEAKQLLIEMGIEEPSSEHIDKMLNGIGKNAKAKDDLIDRNKGKIAELESKLQEVTKALEDKDNASLSDLEKMQKQIEALEKQRLADELTIKSMKLRNGFAEKGITGEDADKLIDSFNKGTFDFETLGNILNSRVEQAKADLTKELMAKTPNPDGGQNGNNDSDDALLKEIGQTLKGEVKTSDDIVSNYT